MFDKSETFVCPACVASEQADYERVRNALQKDPEVSAELISDATGVSLACVMRMIDSERIAMAEGGVDVRCGQCGARAISVSKKLCEACLAKLEQKIARETRKIKLPDKNPARLGNDSGPAWPSQGSGGTKYKR